MKPRKFLGGFPLLIMLAIANRKGHTATVPQIREAINAATGQTVADSGIFAALDTLDNKRAVRRHGKPRDDLPRNGSNKGRRKMLWVYELTACGEETMRWMVRAIDQLKPSGLSVRNDNGEGQGSGP